MEVFASAFLFAAGTRAGLEAKVNDLERQPMVMPHGTSTNVLIVFWTSASIRAGTILFLGLLPYLRSFILPAVDAKN